jgi:ElaA protein
VTLPETYDVRVGAFDDIDPRTAYRLWQLRESVFVVEQACPYAELDGRDLEPRTRHVWITERSEPVAYLRVLDDGDRDRIGRVLVAREHRARGLADALMTQALRLVGDRPSCLDAQTYLVHWYARLGYSPAGEEFVEDGIPHLPMRRP